MLDNDGGKTYGGAMARPGKRRKRLVPPTSAPVSGISEARKSRYVEMALIAMLLGFGVYHSVIYFGHQVVPNSDFPGFVQTGRQLLAGQLPSDYKRAPVVGILQVTLSRLAGGQHPDLTGGWLLNALLHPLSVVLVYLIGRMIVGRAAFWVALIASINPYVLQLVCDPIAETTLMFFVLITFLFILRGSSWAYLFASLTSMVRYEGAALILAAFVMDMIRRKTSGRRWRAFGYAVLASVPLGLWMLGTAWQKKPLADTHYLNVLVLGGQTWDTFTEFMGILWEATLRHLLLTAASVKHFLGTSPRFDELPNQGIFALSKILAVATFLFGCVYGLIQRQGRILALLIFFVPYVMVHSLMPEYIYHRFGTPIHWIVLLVCIYGLQSVWRMINANNRVPGSVKIVLQVGLGVVALVWLAPLLDYPAKLVPGSRDSAYLPYVALGVLAGGIVVCTWRDGIRSLVRTSAVAILLGAMVFSNQYSVARVVGNGDRDIEFKRLADWFYEKGRDGEKLVTTMPGHLKTYAPARRGQVVPTNAIKAADPQDFVSRCREKGVVYVAWDSRLGFARRDRYYKIFGLQHIAMLGQPRDNGFYRFVERIDGNHPSRFINIFRLRER